MKKWTIAAGLFLLGLQSAHAYSVVDRYKLLEDRFKTQDMLNPIGHDFFLDLRVGLNKNLPDVISDASDVADVEGESEALAAAQEFLREYENTEQTLNAKVALGFPLPSFSVFGVEFKPNFRASGNLGANIGIRKEALDANNILDLINVSLPPELEEAIRKEIRETGFGANADIVQQTCTNQSIPANICEPYINQYFFPADDDVPNLFVFAKLDAQAGLFTSYNYGKNIFGSFNLYGMHRTDMLFRISQNALANDQDIIDLGDEENSEVYAMVDYHLGYKMDNYSASVGVEELKLATISDRKEGSKAPVYGTDALIRLHAQAEYKLSNLKVTPFLGAHKRSGYGFGEGAYLGADVMAHVWGERLGIRMRGQIDKEHVTLSPMLKLWLMHIDYTLKQPLSSDVDGVKVSALHSLNFRLFF